MHIVSTDRLQMSSTHSQVFGREISERLDYRNGSQSLQFQRHETELFASAAQRDLAAGKGPQIPGQTLQTYADSLPPAREAPAEGQPIDLEPDTEQLEKLRMLLAALARLNGDFERFASMYEQGAARVLSASDRPEASVTATGPAGVAPAAGLSYQYEVTQWQQEQLQFSASGQVTTADGRVLDFDLALDMQYSHYSHESVSIRAGGQLTDPLVINYGGHAVELGSQTMQFDLNADGKADTLAMLKQGSAYLALDKNGNGRIDDGRELFGALTGNGFAELAAYDDDGNGFIDSADEVFKDLKLWIPDSKGGGRLLGLAEAGIGALGLRHVDGGFDLIADGQLQGQVRSNGLFLFEDGRVGSMQQIDLVM